MLLPYLQMPIPRSQRDKTRGWHGHTWIYPMKSSIESFWLLVVSIVVDARCCNPLDSFLKVWSTKSGRYQLTIARHERILSVKSKNERDQENVKDHINNRKNGSNKIMKTRRLTRDMQVSRVASMTSVDVPPYDAFFVPLCGQGSHILLQDTLRQRWSPQCRFVRSFWCRSLTYFRYNTLEETESNKLWSGTFILCVECST